MSISTSKHKILAGTGIRPLSRGTDYREWRLAVIDMLAEKGYREIVTKSATSTSTDTDDADTKGKAAKAQGLLGRLMDSNHRELYATERHPSKLLTKLEVRYAGRDQAHIWYLHGELSKIRYDNETMVDSIAKPVALFNQLANAGEKQQEKDKLYLLLANHPIQYHPFRTAISNSHNFVGVKGCSKRSRGPTGTAGVIPRRRDGTGPLTGVPGRSSCSGDGRARLGPAGPTRYAFLGAVGHT